MRVCTWTARTSVSCCPTYVRAGAILPTIELEQYVGERNRSGLPNPVTLNVYPGGHGEYTMYLDDGVSRSSAPRRADDDKENWHGAATHARKTSIAKSTSATNT